MLRIYCHYSEFFMVIFTYTVKCTDKCFCLPHYTRLGNLPSLAQKLGYFGKRGTQSELALEQFIK